MTKEYRVALGKKMDRVNRRFEKSVEEIQKRNPNISNNEIMIFVIISFLDEFSDGKNNVINVKLLQKGIERRLRWYEDDLDCQMKNFLYNFLNELAVKNG